MMLDTGALLSFLAHFGATLALTGIFLFAYLWITPFPELRMIREGQVAPAVSLGGALIGFALPVSSAVAHSGGFFDMLLWAGISGIAQTLLFLLLRFTVMRGLKMGSEQMSFAVIVAALSIVVGLLNAACLT
jgi:putative membrane protein